MQQYSYSNVDNTTGKRYTYNGQTKNFGYTYKNGGIGDVTTYPNSAKRTKSLGRLAQVNKSVLSLPGGKTNTARYELFFPAESIASSAIGKITYEELGRILNYNYTSNGNISTITDGELNSSVVYDEADQLIRENNGYTQKTVTYEYDAGGNILSKTTYPYTTGSLEGQTGETVNYSYTDSEWKDLLTAYNGQAITYDTIGNPLSYRNGMTFTWQNGRKLATAEANGRTIGYEYGESGVRTKKTVDGVTTEYFLEGSSILAQKTGSNTIWYYYDSDGTREAMEYGGEVYYYLYNAQGDVLALYDNNLNIVTEYTYDSWGKVINITGSLAGTVGEINPFRYRGYYYDTETELYYVSSRYYDPEIGRWISAEPNVDYGEFDEGSEILGYNVYAYCFNNPVKNFDPDGEAVANIVGGVIGGVAGAALGYLLANALGLKGWKKWALISAATVGGAVLGAFLGPYVAKLAKSIRTTVKIGFKQVAKYRKFTENANKVHHFFVKGQHKLGGLLRKFGGNERKAYDAIYRAVFNKVKKKGLSGTFETVVRVGGQNVTVRGRVINGIVRIGTGFIR